MTDSRKQEQTGETPDEVEVRTTDEPTVDQEPEAESIEVEVFDTDIDPEVDPDAEVEPEPPTELELMRQQRDALQEKWLRVVAELDNVRKRARREVADTRRLTRADILRSMLDVQDNFERALQSFDDQEDTGNHESLRDGVQLIYDSFQRVLTDRGVEPIEAEGEEFDPAVHEAVGQLARDGVETGIVVEVLQQGYKLGDLVLRPARVLVSS